MLEFGMLADDEKRIAAELAVEGGVDYVKNSSGWGKGGRASVDDVRLLKRLVGNRAKVKASGGIRAWADAVALLATGADLLGTSATIVSPSGITREPAPHVEPVDTTGAGDAFNGALAVALAEGKSIGEAVKYACYAGHFASCVAK
jgi:hypothetical protein